MSQPARGLQPSVLDRLCDPESAGTAMLSGYSVEQMVGAVLRDLNELLNTVQGVAAVPAEFPQTRDSIVCYGLPDLTSTPAVSNDQRQGIGRAIKRTIERFEPRLRAVKVTLLQPQEDLTRLAIRFRVDARLAVDPAPDVAFDTVLELGSGKYLVTPAAA